MKTHARTETLFSQNLWKPPSCKIMSLRPAVDAVFGHRPYSQLSIKPAVTGLFLAASLIKSQVIRFLDLSRRWIIIVKYTYSCGGWMIKVTLRNLKAQMRKHFVCLCETILVSFFIISLHWRIWNQATARKISKSHEAIFEFQACIETWRRHARFCFPTFIVFVSSLMNPTKSATRSSRCSIFCSLRKILNFEYFWRL